MVVFIQSESKGGKEVEDKVKQHAKSFFFYYIFYIWSLFNQNFTYLLPYLMLCYYLLK